MSIVRIASPGMYSKSADPLERLRRPRTSWTRVCGASLSESKARHAREEAVNQESERGPAEQAEPAEPARAPQPAAEGEPAPPLSLIHISEPTRLGMIS